MASGWYAVQTSTGWENKIEKIIRMMLKNGELDKEVVIDIKIPTEEVVDTQGGKRRVRTHKTYSGYIFVEMDLPDAPVVWKANCSRIKKIQGVHGFVGTLGDAKPQPLPADEVRNMLQKAGDIKGERPARARQSFSSGEQVKIIDGPFESFTGTIEDVNHEKNKLKVMVGIFGRNTPVEVDLMQVEKL
ncbi:MAG: transcription termination/antitermination protein NusG [Treponema sp.]|jgi:transcriptional antiterminator NusG|nr:transcription termination/antitermination protein NusG [Treponema sp.]